MRGVFETVFAKLHQAQFFRGIGAISFGDVAEFIADGTFESCNLSGSFFSHGGILPGWSGFFQRSGALGVCVIVLGMKTELRGKVAVFDLDGTLLADCFAGEIVRFTRELAEMTGEKIEGSEFLARWWGIQGTFRNLLHVDPIMISLVAEILMAQYGVNPDTDEGRQLRYGLNRELYNPQEVRLCDGAHEALESAEKHSPQVLIGTIARKGWTRFKLEKSGLKRYFPNGNVHCFEVRREKAEQWSEFLEAYGLAPEEVFVVGDTYSADIAPMLRLGVKTAFWVWNPTRMSEAEFEARVVDEGVIKLKTVGELKQYLESEGGEIKSPA